MNSRIFIITVVLFAFASTVFAQKNIKLAERIKQDFKSPLSRISEQDIYLKKDVNILSAKDIATLKEIVEENSFPAISLVGERASHLFWALVMQCNTDIIFQMKVLKLMQGGNEKGDVSTSDFAMLNDRVRMNRELPQLYGTQYVISKDTEEWVPYETMQPEKLQERRKSLNLPDATPRKAQIIAKGKVRYTVKTKKSVIKQL